jgi:hypothetical protein
MGMLIELTGLDQAKRCWEKAREAQNEDERIAWQRLARAYFKKRERARTPAIKSLASAQLCQRMGSR